MPVSLPFTSGQTSAVAFAAPVEAGMMLMAALRPPFQDRKSTRLNSSHTVIYTLSLHDALPIYAGQLALHFGANERGRFRRAGRGGNDVDGRAASAFPRSEEHTSELQSHRDLHSFPTRRSSDLCRSACPSLRGKRARSLSPRRSRRE